MENEKGIEMKKDANQWSTLALKAVKTGGSSYKNISEFIDSLFQ